MDKPDHLVSCEPSTIIHANPNPIYLPGGQQMSQDEQQKLSLEYQEYQKKLEQQKEDYRKEHPDEVSILSGHSILLHRRSAV